MSAPAITLAAVRKFNPCTESYNRISAILPKRGKITAQQARDAGCTLDDIVWIASALARNDKEVDRRVRHWLADCSAHVLHIYEKDYPNDARPRDAIQAGRDFADGLIRAAAWAAAWDAARDAARDAAWGTARGAAWGAARDAARDAQKKRFHKMLMSLEPK